MDITIAEVQIVIRAGVGGEPVLAVHLFAVGHKPGKDVFAVLAAGFRDRLAAGLYDLEIVVVHPDASLKISPAFFDVFRGHFKHIGVNLVYVLRALVKDVIQRKLFAGEHERHLVANVVKVLFGHGNAVEG